MPKHELPLKDVSIWNLFSGDNKCTYEVPIYQRNYAWEKDEITTLVQDIYDAFKNDDKKPYYIGTLVSFHKGDQVYEIIDGQQRLTTLKLLFAALDIQTENKLTYRARKKSDDTLKKITGLVEYIDETDNGIENGFNYAKAAIKEIISEDELTEKEKFTFYFQNNVRIIHYQVPKDIDLNHYFEIMNSRGEQLEKHQIVKAKLMGKLNDDEKTVFNRIWEACSDMSVYIQQNLNLNFNKNVTPETVFGQSLDDFLPDRFEYVLDLYHKSENKEENEQKFKTIEDIIKPDSYWNLSQRKKEEDRKDSFLPIIDFPNFLLIVLKLTRMEEPEFIPGEFNLDDKELINEFDMIVRMDAEKIKRFSFNLLKARFFLDNYIVHHSTEEDKIDSNPWKLQVWHKYEDSKRGQLKNLSDDDALQNPLAQLLSMFEVSFTARQRKNYLFYCLLYLMNTGTPEIPAYLQFAEELADRYFNQVYLNSERLNTNNTPKPNSFDEEILDGNKLNTSQVPRKNGTVFYEIYGDGSKASNGVPLYVFNYLDFKLWKLYNTKLRGEKYKEGSAERQEFFDKLGCSDFGQNTFDQFYFSRTRRSLEHYYPQASATGEGNALTQDQINCFGNYAMIGSEANSSGSNWDPWTKLDHYLDSSRKIDRVSVASLKFMIMMQICKEHQEWKFDEIQNHQDKMIRIMTEDHK